MGIPGDSGSSIWGWNQTAKILVPALLFPGGATLTTLLSLHEFVFYEMGAVLSISKGCCEGNMSQSVCKSMSPSGAETVTENLLQGRVQGRLGSHRRETIHVVGDQRCSFTEELQS